MHSAHKTPILFTLTIKICSKLYKYISSELN